MEKIILVNAVKTSSQPSSSEINLDGKVVKIAITDGQLVQVNQVVLAFPQEELPKRFPGESEGICLNRPAKLTLSLGSHASGVFPQVKHSHMERGKKKPLPFKLYPYPIRVQKNFCQFTINALERLLVDQKIVESRICERSLWQVVQTFRRSLLIVTQDASLVLLLIRLQQLADFVKKKSRCKSNLMLMVRKRRAIALCNKSDHCTQSFINPSPT